MSNFKLGGHVSVNNRKGFISEIVSDDSLKVTFEDGMTVVAASSEVVKRRGRPKRVESLAEVPLMTVCDDGTIFYRLQNGLFHREDGPAVIREDGSVEYYQNGVLHREDGPALIYSNGFQAYFVNGNYHRTDGPAVILVDGRKEYWVHGLKYSKEEFEALSA